MPAGPLHERFPPRLSSYSRTWASMASAALPVPRQAAARPWVILFVDDEPDILDAIQELLEASIPGCRVLSAPSARVALEILASERIDLIVSDFKMPGMDGIEFLFQARRLHPNIPRVMFTAFHSEDLARRAISEVLVSAFLSKTSEPQTLVDRLAGLLRYEPGQALPPHAPPPGPPPNA